MGICRRITKVFSTVDKRLTEHSHITTSQDCFLLLLLSLTESKPFQDTSAPHLKWDQLSDERESLTCSICCSFDATSWRGPPPTINQQPQSVLLLRTPRRSVLSVSCVCLRCDEDAYLASSSHVRCTHACGFIGTTLASGSIVITCQVSGVSMHVWLAS